MLPRWSIWPPGPSVSACRARRYEVFSESSSTGKSGTRTRASCSAGLSSSAYYDWKKKPDRVLDVDRITRISYLVGIYKGLHILYGDKLADEWVSLPNSNAIFGGRSALAYMIGGGLIAMQTVRKLLDARRGG